MKRNLPRRLLLAFLLVVLAAPVAEAGPPSYLLLRRADSPPPHGSGHAGAQMLDAGACGYAYGYFGPVAKQHPQRHFGIYRTYTQWSFW